MGEPTASPTVRAIRPDRSVQTLQRLPYFIGVSGSTVGARGLSMHLVVIPPGARAEPHIHVGYENGIYMNEWRATTPPSRTRWCRTGREGRRRRAAHHGNEYVLTLVKLLQASCTPSL